MKGTGLKSMMLLMVLVIAVLIFNHVSSDAAEQTSQQAAPETQVEADAETTATHTSQPDVTSQQLATTEETAQQPSESVTGLKQEGPATATVATTEDDTIESIAPTSAENVAQAKKDTPMMLRLSAKKHNQKRHQLIVQVMKRRQRHIRFYIRMIFTVAWWKRKTACLVWRS